MKISYIDIADEWTRIKPLLRRPAIKDALDIGMYAYCALHGDNGFKVYNPRRGPYAYTSGDWWCEHRAVGYQRYQCFGACHWLAGFNYQLGNLLYPRHIWSLVTSDDHSTAIGMTANECLVCDILRFDMKETPVKRTLRDAGLTNNLENDHADILTYMAWEYHMIQTYQNNSDPELPNMLAPIIGF